MKRFFFQSSKYRINIVGNWNIILNLPCRVVQKTLTLFQSHGPKHEYYKSSNSSNIFLNHVLVLFVTGENSTEINIQNNEMAAVIKNLKQGHILSRTI